MLLMTRLFAWLRSNKLTVVLLVVIGYFLYASAGISYPVNRFNPDVRDSAGVYSNSEMMPEMMGDYAPSSPPFFNETTPQLDVANRKVVTNSSLSLVVSNVRNSVDEIQDEVDKSGGYMVSNNVNTPEGLGSGNITIRVPSGQLRSLLTFLRNAAVKVVSENIDGYDVTDEFVDVEARLTTLEKTKAIYEAMLSKAVNVDEIMRVQQAVLGTQDQIDSLKGRLRYLDATSRSSLITVYLSTDEFELPYTPDQPWRPNVVFKYAIRSLIEVLRTAGSAIIWVGVYSIIWLPALALVIFIRKRLQTKKTV